MNLILKSAEKSWYYDGRREDRTILFVSHRLTSAVICDRILYMEDGRIKESGSHRELMERNGGYARLFRAQTSVLENRTKLDV